MKSHAIILGGGIAGLLAAHALSGRFDRISLLERGTYPELQSEGSPAVRPGVPQSRCLHLLMASGVAAFDELVPGWREQLLSLGGVAFDASADTEMRLSTGWLPRASSGMTLYACSRSLLEYVLRLKMADDASMSLHTGKEVTRLTFSQSEHSVSGVWVRRAGCEQEEWMAADVVVDTSGRTSRLPLWLEALADDDHTQPEGHGGKDTCSDRVAVVRETTVPGNRRQVACWYHINPDDAPDWQCLAIAPDEGNHYRSAMMLRAEHHRWGVVLVDASGAALPTEHEAFLSLADRFDDGKLSAALKRARPVSRVHRLQPSVNRWRHYESVENWPSGLYALGDSTCMLDPYCGLGMSVAARGAVLLKTAFHSNSAAATDSHRFQQALAGQDRHAWELATGCNSHGQALHEDSSSLQQLYTAAPGSQAITHAILAVQHLLSPREALMSLSLT